MLYFRTDDVANLLKVELHDNSLKCLPKSVYITINLSPSEEGSEKSNDLSELSWIERILQKYPNAQLTEDQVKRIQRLQDGSQLPDTDNAPGDTQ